MKTDFWRITIDTNPEDCNLNCIMCEEHSQYSSFKRELFATTGVRTRRMTKELLIRTIQDAANAGVKEIIPTTMGDPLVSDSIFTMINECKKTGIKLNVTHNGTFPGRTVQEWASLLIPITTDIKISWNGASSKTAQGIMKGLDFEKAVSGLTEFIDFRNQHFKDSGYYCKVTLQLTFMKSNMQEIFSIIDFAYKLGIDRIKGHHLWAHFPEIEELSFEKDDKSRQEWNEISEKVHEYVNERNSKSKKSLIIENFHRFDSPNEIEVPHYYNCPFLGKELWIAADGTVSPCCAPDNLRKDLGVFGNIKSISLTDVLESKPYIELLKNYKENEICRHCKMRKQE